MKISAIDSDHRSSGNEEPVAVAYKEYRGDLKQTSNSMFIRRRPDGKVQTATTPAPLFGDLLTEKHPVRTIELKGQQVPVGRYELVCGALERYEPRSAAALAAARLTRELNKAAREQ